MNRILIGSGQGQFKCATHGGAVVSKCAKDSNMYCSECYPNGCWMCAGPKRGVSRQSEML